jgi:hypothetical protein
MGEQDVNELEDRLTKVEDQAGGALQRLTKLEEKEPWRKAVDRALVEAGKQIGAIRQTNEVGYQRLLERIERVEGRLHELERWRDSAAGKVRDLQALPDEQVELHRRIAELEVRVTGVQSQIEQAQPGELVPQMLNLANTKQLEKLAESVKFLSDSRPHDIVRVESLEERIDDHKLHADKLGDIIRDKLQKVWTRLDAITSTMEGDLEVRTTTMEKVMRAQHVFANQFSVSDHEELQRLIDNNLVDWVSRLEGQIQMLRGVIDPNSRLPFNRRPTGQCQETDHYGMRCQGALSHEGPHIYPNMSQLGVKKEDSRNIGLHEAAQILLRFHDELETLEERSMLRKAILRVQEAMS